MCLLSTLIFPLDQNLSLPPISPPYLNCSEDYSANNETTYVPRNLPFEDGPVIFSDISSATILSEGDDVKTTLEIMLNIEGFLFPFKPGGTIGILPENPPEDVSFLLERLHLNKVDCKYKIDVVEGSKKKKPPHLPPEANARFLFQKCLDLRSVVKKAFLRSLVDYTADDLEKRRLTELCSREGSGEYNAQILNNKSSIIDVLKAFPSCVPPLALLLEHLPRLQPRPYSIASSPLESPSRLRIVFNIAYDSRNRRGICSGWLYDISRPFHDITHGLRKLELDEKSSSIKVPIYLRKSTKFQIPEDPAVPLFMIGPGTGVAPFIGFLDHRRKQYLSSDEQANASNLLLFGCRYPKKDEIYKEELKSFEETGICKYLVCYSRAEKTEGAAKYVQDILKQKQDIIVPQILSSDTHVFICGNGLGMGKDVVETLAHCIKNVQGISEGEAKELVNKLEENGRILKDLWF